MGTIIAIGGGEIGRPGYSVETMAIDREIIRLTGKKHPCLLFIPTASNDSQLYIDTLKKHFGKRLGCRIETLCLIQNHYTKKQITQKIFSSDIIYVGGGNTLRMLKVWRKKGLLPLLKKAFDNGVILSGLSAGAVCWFRYACSDSWRMKNPRAPYIKLSGLDLVNATLCPHYDAEPARKPGFKRMMKTTPGVGIALENCTALEIVGDQYRVITSRPGAKAYKVYWKRGRFSREPLEIHEDFHPLAQVLKTKGRRQAGDFQPSGSPKGI